MRNKKRTLGSWRPAIWMLVVAAALALPAPAAAGPSAPLLDRGGSSPVMLDRGAGYAVTGGSERVRDLQRTLNRLGYDSGKADGLFGPITEGAVARFQTARGLEADGVVGPRTRRQLARSDARRAERPSGSGAVGDRTRVPRDGTRRFVVNEASGNSWWELVLPLAASIGALLSIVLGLLALREGRRERRPSAASGIAAAGAGANDRLGPNGEPSLRRAHTHTSAAAWRAQLIDVPYARRLVGVGARLDAVDDGGFGLGPDVLEVQVRLFAEGQRGRWETRPLDAGAPFFVAPDTLEDAAEELVLPQRLPLLARTLREAGIRVEPADLEVLPFMVEISPELERRLIERRFERGAAGTATHSVT